MPSTVGYIAGVGQVRLTLELTPQPTENGGDILATAILTTERNPLPLEGHTIVFYLGPSEVTAERTNTDGRASHTFTAISFGTYAISVQTAGVHVTQRHTFTKPAERSGKLARPNFHAGGDEGDYIISGALTCDDGRPASDEKVQLTISPFGKAPLVEYAIADKHGFVSYPLNFEEAECDVTVQVRGFEQSFHLYGPSRSKKPPEVPEPPAEDLAVGFFKMIRLAFRRGGEDLKKERTR